MKVLIKMFIILYGFYYISSGTYLSHCVDILLLYTDSGKYPKKLLPTTIEPRQPPKQYSLV